MEKKSFWADIQNNYTEDVNANGVVRITYIDAWQTDDDNEEGKVIAKIILTQNDEIIVDYIDHCAAWDEFAKEKIQEAIEDFRKEVSASKKIGIFYENGEYVCREFEPDKLDIKAENLKAVVFDEASAKAIADAFNNMR